MFRKLLLVALALPLLYFAGRWVRHALASDETRIRWVVEDMLAGFNAAQARPILSGLARDFVDSGSGATREDLRGALLSTFLQDTDPTTRRFLYSVELPEDGLEIELDEAGGSARVRLHALFFVQRGGEAQPWWDARIAGEMRELDDGWQWVRTSDVNHEARRRR